MSKLSWPEKKTNSFLTEEATHAHLGFASLESSRQSGYKYFLSILQTGEKVLSKTQYKRV